jgi:hypothetical protein
VAGIVVGGLATVLIARSGWENGARHVTLTVSHPCANPQPLILGDHAWWTREAAPSSWGNGSERGTFRVTRPGRAVFRSDHDGRQLTLHENPSRFTTLDCTVGG